jgi:hypothetical protein
MKLILLLTFLCLVINSTKLTTTTRGNITCTFIAIEGVKGSLCLNLLFTSSKNLKISLDKLELTNLDLTFTKDTLGLMYENYKLERNDGSHTPLTPFTMGLTRIGSKYTVDKIDNKGENIEMDDHQAKSKALENKVKRISVNIPRLKLRGIVKTDKDAYEEKLKKENPSSRKGKISPLVQGGLKSPRGKKSPRQKEVKNVQTPRPDEIPVLQALHYTSPVDNIFSQLSLSHEDNSALLFNLKSRIKTTIEERFNKFIESLNVNPELSLDEFLVSLTETLNTLVKTAKTIKTVDDKKFYNEVTTELNNESFTIILNETEELVKVGFDHLKFITSDTNLIVDSAGIEKLAPLRINNDSSLIIIDLKNIKEFVTDKLKLAVLCMLNLTRVLKNGQGFESMETILAPENDKVLHNMIEGTEGYLSIIKSSKDPDIKSDEKRKEFTIRAFRLNYEFQKYFEKNILRSTALHHREIPIEKYFKEDGSTVQEDFE